MCALAGHGFLAPTEVSVRKEPEFSQCDGVEAGSVLHTS